MGMVVLFLLGCVAQDRYDAVATERDALTERVATLERTALDLRSERDRARKEAADAIAASTAAIARARAVEAEATRALLGLGPDQALSAVIETRLGAITCALWPDQAPRTVRTFVGLAEGSLEWTDPRTEVRRRDPLYSGTVFHRVLPGFMIQGGDPRGDGMGGPGFTIPDEIVDGGVFDRPGLLAMANSGPNTNGSQFFVTSAPAHQIDGKHTIFGSCDTGVVEAVMAEPLERARENPRETSRPRDPVRIDRIRIVRG
jgi:peptidyl-prolyl cis-trans isomerase A (cyclophilin A)